MLNWFSAAAINTPLPLYYEVQDGWCFLLEQARYINSKAWQVSFTLFTFLFPVCILIYGSWKTTRVMFRRTRAIHNQTENQSERLSKGQVNITITMVVVVVVFLVCLLPYQIALAVYTVDIIGYDAEIFGPLFVVCLINCCITRLSMRSSSRFSNRDSGKCFVFIKLMLMDRVRKPKKRLLVKSLSIFSICFNLSNKVVVVKDDDRFM